MIIVIFLITFIIQLLTLLIAFNRKEKALQGLVLFSIPINLLFILFFYFRIHHIIKNEYSIPNTFFYIFYFIICLIFFLYISKKVRSYSNWFLVAAFILWVFSGLLDLISDARLFKVKLPDFWEEAAMFLGSFFWLAFYLQIFYKTLFLSKPQTLPK